MIKSLRKLTVWRLCNINLKSRTQMGGSQSADRLMQMNEKGKILCFHFISQLQP